MSYYSRGNPFGFVVTPWVKRLLIANLAVFVLATIVGLATSPLLVQEYLGFSPRHVLYRPWTVATYMFVHLGPFHLLFNLLAIFFFGPPLEDRWGGREFLKFYLLAGLGGAALSLVLPNVLIIGASAAVYGILVAFALYWPDNPIYFFGIFPVKAKWLVMGLIGISLFYSATAPGHGGVAHLAHLGGALAAFGYLKSPWAPSAWGSVTRPHRKSSGSAFSRWGFRRRKPAEPTPQVREVALPRAPRRGKHSSPEIDDILDKISEHGIGSLSAEELQRLKEASKHR